jgi:hypothetical protein
MSLLPPSLSGRCVTQSWGRVTWELGPRDAELGPRDVGATGTGAA